VVFKNPYWSEVLKASALQRWIIVNSILYYEMDKIIVDDKRFDENARQLVSIMKTLSKEEMKRTDYYYCMYDFDGSTGFYLYSRLNKLDKIKLSDIANRVYKLYTNK
jgi:hypothetical protein